MVKERVSLTLDREVVEKLDRKLEKDGIENRSRGVETLLRDVLKNEVVSTAFVLGGGNDSSCLIPVNGKPVIQHALDYLDAAGVERVVVATADAEVRDLVEAHGAEVLYEDEPQGTGGSLREIADDIDEAFLVLNGDVLCEVDLEDMQRAHRDGEGIATVALTTVDDASAYGVIQMKGNRVVGFKEKPAESTSHLVNAGVYLLEPAFLDRIPPKDEEQRVDIESMFERVADEELLNGYVYDGEWREVG